MGLYSQYKTDPELEKKGVVIDYHHFRVRIARAGGANTEFLRVMAAKTKPHRRAIQTETIDRELSERLIYEVFAETVVLEWETLVDEEGMVYKVGVEGPDGNLLPVTVKNLVATFRNLPEVFADIKEQSEKIALFRQEIVEADTKNSEKS